MPVFAISAGELRRLAGMGAGDTSADAALALVQASEQAAVEWTIDPDTVFNADAGLTALLTLGVAEALVASYLGQLARDPLALGTSNLGPVRLVPPTSAEWQALAAALAAKSAARLAPFLRRGSLVAATSGAALAEGSEPLPPPVYGPLLADAPPPYNAAEAGEWEGSL